MGGVKVREWVNLADWISTAVTAKGFAASSRSKVLFPR